MKPRNIQRAQKKTKQKDISGSSWSEGHLDVYAWGPEVSSDSSCEGGGGNSGAGGALDFRDTRTLAHGLLWPGPGWRLAVGMHYFFGWWLCTNCTICATVCGGSWGGMKCESTASAAERFATLCLIFCSLQWGAFMSVRSSVCVLVCMSLTDQVSTRTYTPKILSFVEAISKMQLWKHCSIGSTRVTYYVACGRSRVKSRSTKLYLYVWATWNMSV